MGFDSLTFKKSEVLTNFARNNSILQITYLQKFNY